MLLGLVRDFRKSVDLIIEASSLLDYEDEKKPTFGIKYECEKFVKKVKRKYCK
jgi:hypothetical protein